MDAEALRAIQAPWKQKYQADPKSASFQLVSRGNVDPGKVTCSVATESGEVVTGLHPGTGGDGASACSANLLLDALVGCAGVTLGAVASALSIPLAGVRIEAAGDLDFRGTLGLDRTIPVGYQSISLTIQVDSTADDEQLATLLKLTERYCVVYQTLAAGTQISATLERDGQG